MEQEKTFLEVCNEYAEKELDFLPPDPAVRAGYMAAMQYLILIT